MQRSFNPGFHVRVGEGVVEKRPEDAGASLLATIRHELAEYHVVGLIEKEQSFVYNLFIIFGTPYRYSLCILEHER